MKNLVLAFVGLVVVLTLGVSVSPVIQAAAPTPSPGAMTIYQVVNPNSVMLITTHEFINAASTPVYTVNYSLAAVSNATFHVRDMTQVPSPFNGSVKVSANLPFTADVVGYDYPVTNTPTPTATRTNTPTASPTRTATPTATRVVIILPVLK